FDDAVAFAVVDDGVAVVAVLVARAEALLLPGRERNRLRRRRRRVQAGGRAGLRFEGAGEGAHGETARLIGQRIVESGFGPVGTVLDLGDEVGIAAIEGDVHTIALRRAVVA